MYPYIGGMSEEQIQRQIQVLEEGTKKLLQNKEAALDFLERAGILALCPPSPAKGRKKKKK